MKHRAICRAYIVGGALTVAPAFSASGEPTMQLFLQACAIPYTHEELVEREVRAIGFFEVRGENAAKYLGNAIGRVWAGTLQSKRFVVALRPEISCTVIAHDGTSEDIGTAVESWLPPSDSGIAVKIEAVQAPATLKTTSYELRGGKVKERWVVTLSTDSTSETRAMLSWSRL